MSKKLLALLGSYVSGVVISLLYSKKNPSEIKAELDEANKSGKNVFKVLFDNFIEIHQNFLKEFEKKFLAKESRELFYAKMDSFLNLVQDYKSKAQKIFDECKSLGEDYSSEGLKKLEKFYDKKLREIDDLKKEVLREIKKAQKKLLGYYNDFKAKLKK